MQTSINISRFKNHCDCEDLGSVNIPVPFRMPGNVIRYQPVEFRVYQTMNFFRTEPLCGPETRRILNLPEQINFEVFKSKVISSNPHYAEIGQKIIETLSRTKRLILP